MGDFEEGLEFRGLGSGVGILGFSGLGEPSKQIYFGIFLRFCFSHRRSLRARPSIRPSLST